MFISVSWRVRLESRNPRVHTRSQQPGVRHHPLSWRADGRDDWREIHRLVRHPHRVSQPLGVTVLSLWRQLLYDCSSAAQRLGTGRLCFSCDVASLPMVQMVPRSDCYIPGVPDWLSTDFSLRVHGTLGGRDKKVPLHVFCEINRTL